MLGWKYFLFEQEWSLFSVISIKMTDLFSQSFLVDVLFFFALITGP